jgi:hypothetical protein
MYFGGFFSYRKQIIRRNSSDSFGIRREKTMNTMKDSTRVDRTLRDLARLAYERELTNELKRLKQLFSEWETSALSVWELDEQIRSYAREQSRELHTRYHHTPLDLVVAFAIVDGVIRENEVPVDILPHLSHAMDCYQFTLSDGASGTEDNCSLPTRAIFDKIEFG